MENKNSIDMSLCYLLLWCLGRALRHIYGCRLALKEGILVGYLYIVVIKETFNVLKNR